MPRGKPKQYWGLCYVFDINFPKRRKKHLPFFSCSLILEGKGNHSCIAMSHFPHYLCRECGELAPEADYEVDKLMNPPHLLPVIWYKPRRNHCD